MAVATSRGFSFQEAVFIAFGERTNHGVVGFVCLKKNPSRAFCPTSAARNLVQELEAPLSRPQITT